MQHASFLRFDLLHVLFRLLTRNGLGHRIRSTRASLCVVAAWCLIVGASAARAQSNIQYTKNSSDTKQRGELRVNPATRAVEFQISFAAYPGRAGLNLPVTLFYSSKVWRVDYQGYVPGPVQSMGAGPGYIRTIAKYAEKTTAGWTSSLSFPQREFSGEQGETYNQSGGPAVITGAPAGNNCTDNGGCFNVDRWRVRMPDGSTHELRSTDQPYSISNHSSISPDYYAVDGSGLRFQSSTGTLFLPDGSRYLLTQTPGYIDRNGNMLTYDDGTRRWTDTLGRTIDDPLATAPYSVPGVGGVPIPYTLVWKKLSDPGVLTTPQPLRYVANQGCPQS